MCNKCYDMAAINSKWFDVQNNLNVHQIKYALSRTKEY